MNLRWIKNENGKLILQERDPNYVNERFRWINVPVVEECGDEVRELLQEAKSWVEQFCDSSWIGLENAPKAKYFLIKVNKLLNK